MAALSALLLRAAPARAAAPAAELRSPDPLADEVLGRYAGAEGAEKAPGLRVCPSARERTPPREQRRALPGARRG